jgi:hypothetical protein
MDAGLWTRVFGHQIDNRNPRISSLVSLSGRGATERKWGQSAVAAREMVAP